jgi:hypothetical protein
MAKVYSILAGGYVDMPDKAKGGAKSAVPSVAAEIADLRVALATAEVRATAAEDHARELASRLAAAESALAVERSRPRPAPVVNVSAGEPAAYEVVVTDRDDKGRLKKLSMVPR